MMLYCWSSKSRSRYSLLVPERHRQTSFLQQLYIWPPTPCRAPQTHQLKERKGGFSDVGIVLAHICGPQTRRRDGTKKPLKNDLHVNFRGTSGVFCSTMSPDWALGVVVDLSVSGPTAWPALSDSWPLRWKKGKHTKLLPAFWCQPPPPNIQDGDHASVIEVRLLPGFQIEGTYRKPCGRRSTSLLTCSYQRIVEGAVEPQVGRLLPCHRHMVQECFVLHRSTSTVTVYKFTALHCSWILIFKCPGYISANSSDIKSSEDFETTVAICVLPLKRFPWKLSIRN